MAQEGFGRRQVLPAGTHSANATGASPAASVDVREALALADAPSRAATRSVMILAGVGALVVVMALGAAYGLNAAVSSNAAPAAAKQECRGAQPGCVNQYRVALACGASDEAKVVVIEARDAEAAQRKAERYNRNCSSRRAVFVTSLARSAARTAFGGDRYQGSSRKYTNRSTGTRRTWRFRFRRR
jgi:hypothetical protein